MRRTGGEKAVAESPALGYSNLMSPLRLFKRWIASEHQHLGSPLPHIPISHLPEPKCCSPWCLQIVSWRKIHNVRTGFLSWVHSLTVAVGKRKKKKEKKIHSKNKSAEDACVQFVLQFEWFSAVRSFELLTSPLMGISLLFFHSHSCFAFLENWATMYLHKKALA